MQATTYIFRNPNCDREPSAASIIRPLKGRAKGAALIRKLALRNKLQTAISDLIRCYEMTSGNVVVRMEIGGENRNVTLEAVPEFDRAIQGFNKN